MKALKEAAVIMGWGIVFLFGALFMFFGGMGFCQVTNRNGWVVASAACMWLAFFLGKLYERHKEAINPLEETNHQ